MSFRPFGSRTVFFPQVVRGIAALCLLVVAATTFGSDADASHAGLVTFEDIKKISPRADDDFVRAMIDAEDEFDAAGINTRLRMAHFLAQVMTETGGLARIDENMNYSFPTLMRVFSRRVVSEAKARELTALPTANSVRAKAIANWVYGDRLGNRGRDTQDGWNYRGSGYIQLTGRRNFRLRGEEVGLPLEAQPELARRVPEGLRAALAYWDARNINAAADDHDRLRVRVLVNGAAAHGFPQSKVWFNRAWIRVFRDKEAEGFELAQAEESALEAAGALEDEAALFDEIMEDSGLLAAAAIESAADPAAVRAEALRTFQEEIGLPVTGELDAATQDALLDPREWRHNDPEREIEPRPGSDLEQTVVFRLAESDAAGTEAAAVAPVQPSEGTGETVSDPDMAPDLELSLGAASAIYPEYEMGGRGVTPETFVPFAVIGADDRVAVLDTTVFPARAIVQILFETASGWPSLCTGSMVSEDTVVTAAHCLHSGTASGRPHRDFQVIPGRNTGAAPFGRCRGTHALVLRGWTEALTSEESRYYDLGALKLDCQIGTKTGWLGVRVLTDDEAGLATTVQGYAADKAPPGRQWRSEDSLRLLWELKGFYQNDTFGGTSGSPVFATDHPGTLIGVHTNGLHGEPPWANFNAFTRITPERLARIREWITF